MPICIECRYPVPQLYHVLHSSNKRGTPTNPSTQTAGNGTQRSSAGGPKIKATEGATGGDVRLTQCPRCKRFADKYVEHDFVVLFIDLVLVKPQVYRHLLFNRLGRSDDELDPSITRLGVLLLLFDVYLTWSHIESLSPALTASSQIPNLPILLQYAFYFLLCFLTTLAQHLTIRWLARFLSLGATTITSTSPTSATCSSGSSAQAMNTTSKPTSNGNSVSTALFVSSCMKLFPILMVVWKYDDAGGNVGRGVEWAVAVQNLEALRILLGCGYVGAAGLVAVGWAGRWMVARVVLGVVGLGEVM